MNDWLELVRALNRTMTAHAPEWTDHNDSDPGITTLELMAFLAEGLQFHHEASPEASIRSPFRSTRGPEWSRIEEGCRVVLANDSCEHGVTIVRLIRDQNHWRADDTFVPARLR